MPRIALSAGSNVSAYIVDATKAVQNARIALEGALGVLVVSSPIYRTPAFPKGAGPDFANAVFQAETDMSAEEVLQVCHRIEAEAGRTREIRWGQRSLDLDLLAHGDAVAPDKATWQHWAGLSPERQTKEAPEELILPHPRIQDRAFVLVPWSDLAPDWCHPMTGLTVAQMRDALPPEEIAGVVPLDQG